MRSRKPTKKWSEGEIEAKIREFDDKIKDQKENAGDMEVRDTMMDKAEFYAFEV